MSHFPVISSNLSAPHLGLFLQKKYGFSELTKCEIIKAGVNHTYSVKDGESKYIFRVYSLNWRYENDIKEEIRLLNVLKENNISVSYPIKDSDNQYIQILNAPEGNRYAVLFSFAQGEKIHNFSNDTHFQMGKLMAELHAVTGNMTLQKTDYTPEVLLVEPLSLIAPFLSDNSSEMDFLKSSQTYLLNELRGANLKEIRRGIVHLDIWFDNVNVDEHNNITIFDFDFCGNGWLCMDIAYYILQLSNIERDENSFKTKKDSFLSGYESVCKISDEEKRLLPALGVSLYYFYLGVQCGRFDNWSNTFINETYLKRFIAVIIKRYFDLNQLGDKTIL